MLDRAEFEENASKLVAGGVIVFAAYMVYKWATKPRAFNHEEYSRYLTLVELYHDRINDSNALPDVWVLNAQHAPITEPDFDSLHAKLNTWATTLKIDVDPMESAGRAMLASIARLFQSLSKRYAGKIHVASVDMMFFIELAAWSYNDLPKLGNFNDSVALNSLEAMKSYCEKVKDRNVLLQESGERAAQRNNPACVLAEIINTFDSMIAITKEYIKAATFIDHVRKLDKALSTMTKQSIHILYSFVEGSSQLEILLPVPLFLAPAIDRIHRPKMEEFKQKRLAGWLEETLIVAGIKDDLFNQTRTLNLADISQHLAGEWMGDADHHRLEKKFEKAEYQGWGHWPFSIKDIEQEQVLEKLRLTREIHRHVLRIYYIRSLLANLIHIGPVFGEVWVYGDEEGRALVNVLIDSIMEYSSALNHDMERLVQPLLQQHNILQRRGKISADSLEDKAAKRIAIFFRSFQEEVALLQAEKEEIIRQSGQFTSRLQDAQKKKQKLLSDVVEMLEFQGKTDTENFRIIKQALELHKSQQSIAQEKIPAQEPQSTVPGPTNSLSTQHTLPISIIGSYRAEVEVKREFLPLFQRAERLLDIARLSVSLTADEAEGFELDTTLPRPTTQYRHQEEEYIATHFLNAYNAMINRGDFWAFPWIKIRDMPEFKQLYLRVNAVIKWVYSINVPQAVTEELRLLDQQLVTRKLLEMMQHCCQRFYKDPLLSPLEYQLRSFPIQYRDKEGGKIGIKGARTILPFAESAALTAYNELDVKFQEVTAEKDRLQEDVQRKDEALVSKDEALASKDAQLQEIRSQIESQRAATARQDAKIAELALALQSAQVRMAEARRAPNSQRFFTAAPPLPATPSHTRGHAPEQAPGRR